MMPIVKHQCIHHLQLGSMLSIPKNAVDLSPSALQLLVIIAARAPLEVEVSISQQDLAAATKTSRSTVQRALLELQEFGFVEVIRRGPSSPILRLPWRDASTISSPIAKPTPSPDSEQRLSSIELRLSDLESKLAKISRK